MSKNVKNILNEYDKINSMKEKIKNSKTLNISLINKNILKSQSSDKIVHISDSNHHIPPTFHNNNNNIIIIEANESNCESPKIIENDIELKESDMIIELKKDINPINTDRFNESEGHK